MEENGRVKFRDVAESYFSQTRVDCRYTISSRHSWNSHDWIGLFKVGWATVKDYHTFAWALAPEGYQTGTDANSSVTFHSSYLPNPGRQAYQFVYLDENSEVCAVSQQFTFCAPRPLEELVTLEQGKNDEDEDEEEDGLLLVVPKAQILQNLLEACQRERQELLQRFKAVDGEAERERERRTMDRVEFEKEKSEMKSQIDELKCNLGQSTEKIEELERKQKDVQSSHDSMCVELSGLLAERAENFLKIKDLEQDVASLNQQKHEIEAELDRMKERAKKMTAQRRDEDKERRDLQTENQQLHADLKVLQERLEAGERSNEALRRDMSELSTLQSHSHAELHQVRLQTAQMSVQLSQANLALREGQVAWAQERESIRQNAELDRDRHQKLNRELQKKEEWLQEERREREKLEVELGNQKDCNRELRASLRALQKEQEQNQMEKQELFDHIHVLELRLDTETDAKWAEAVATATASVDSSSSDVVNTAQEFLLKQTLGVVKREQITSLQSTVKNKTAINEMEVDLKCHYSSFSAEKDGMFSDLTDIPHADV